MAFTLQIGKRHLALGEAQVHIGGGALVLACPPLVVIPEELTDGYHSLQPLMHLLINPERQVILSICVPPHYQEISSG